MVCKSNLLTCYATGPFLHPLETFGFLMFSGGIEKDQWHGMG